MKKLFSPRSIAVVGAAREKGKVGRVIFDNLKLTFGERVFPVNPFARRIGGVKAFSSLSDLPQVPDVAVIAIPSTSVPAVIEECAHLEVPFAVIVSAGFREIGPQGARLERELLKLKGKTRILGPNTLGLINPFSKLNLTFLSTAFSKGPVAFLSQSGALGTFLLEWAERKGIGISKFVSMGNKLDLSEEDFFSYLKKDKETEVVALYIEGVKDGRRFLEKAALLSKEKKVIALKAGITESGARAVSSHTGSLAGKKELYQAAFKKAGIYWAQDIQDFLDSIISLSWCKTSIKKGFAILTNGGGPGILAADSLEREGIKLSNFSAKTVNRLRKSLPSASSVYNPVDVLGDAMAQRVEKAAQIILSDGNVGGLIVILTKQAMTEPKKTAQALVRIYKKKSKKPLLVSFMGFESMEEAEKVFRKNKVPSFLTPERAIRSAKRLTESFPAPERKFERSKYDRLRVKEIIRNVRKECFLSGSDSLEILEAMGFNFPFSRTARSLKEAIDFAREIGFPVAMKLDSPDILHKTDIGGVVLNVSSEDEVTSTYHSLMRQARKFFEGAELKGITVQKMAAPGVEVIVGGGRDVQFGPFVMFGLGGIYVEIFHDVTFSLAPLTFSEAKEMISSIKSFPLLKGARGKRGVDVDSLAGVIVKLAQLISDFPEIQEVDLNPVRVYEKGYMILDAKIGVK
jgi:acetyltransferase